MLAVLVTPPAMAQENQSRRTVNVSGEGVLHVQPDKAIVRFGVVTRDMDPEEARRRNAEAAAAAMNAVRALGVDERKLRLETLSIQPYREFNPETRRYEEKGFEAVREVVVELEDLDRLPALIADVVRQGANRLNGVTYDLRDRAAVRNEALRMAVMNAREKAALMASALGAELGEVLHINEQSLEIPRPVFRMEAAAMAKDAGEAVPEAYASGEIEVRAMVQVAFALK
ncbi:SIMPL domain-containing protein [Rhodocaloribacter litoris]|uniref:SIMPL domain-containing protein n=1 Tax=Rhodocaloribacter litoris TaxID=2558931 RepID=UPI001E4CB472|nr:SIMPL domain-containing protein [Rhodocaloribacter litoris]